MESLSGKKRSHDKESYQKVMVIIIVLTKFIHLEQKINSKRKRISVEIMAIVI